MATNLWQMLMCRFGRHRRSRSQAHDDGIHLRSVCRHCGIPMMRTNRTWAPSSDDEPDTPPAA